MGTAKKGIKLDDSHAAVIGFVVAAWQTEKPGKNKGILSFLGPGRETFRERFLKETRTDFVQRPVE